MVLECMLIDHSARRAFLPSLQCAVYRQLDMRLKLLTSLLVITLSGANAVATAMCASYCASSESAETDAVHHHNDGTQPNNKNSHVHGQGMRCPECPATSGLSQSFDCA